VFVLWGMWNNYERTKLNRLYGQQIEQQHEQWIELRDQQSRHWREMTDQQEEFWESTNNKVRSFIDQIQPE
jgi:hypothetical protein